MVSILRSVTWGFPWKPSPSVGSFDAGGGSKEAAVSADSKEVSCVLDVSVGSSETGGGSTKEVVFSVGSFDAGGGSKVAAVSSISEDVACRVVLSVCSFDAGGGSKGAAVSSISKEVSCTLDVGSSDARGSEETAISFISAEGSSGRVAVGSSDGSKEAADDSATVLDRLSTLFTAASKVVAVGSANVTARLLSEDVAAEVVVCCVITASSLYFPS